MRRGLGTQRWTGPNKQRQAHVLFFNQTNMSYAKKIQHEKWFNIILHNIWNTIKCAHI